MAKGKKHYCYLLESKRTRKTYIGYTVDPPRRLRQHNGEIVGGAKHTRMGRPWRMILYVTGFKSARHAKQCEYATKHCKKAKPKFKEAIANSKKISKNRNVNQRVATFFTALSRKYFTKKEEVSNRDCKLKLTWLVPHYRKLDRTISYCKCIREN